jgi:L-asparaginase II
VVGGGRGLALKIDDGGTRALHPLAMGLLERWSSRGRTSSSASQRRESRLENYAGLEVGRIEAVIA